MAAPSIIATGFPSVPTEPMIDAQGRISPIWHQFLVAIYNRTGGASGQLNPAVFGPQQPGLFIASPTGQGGTGAFRIIQTSDLPAGQLPGTGTNDNANAGNIGEYIESSIDSANAVALISAAPADITSIDLDAGDWNVWGSIATKPDVSTTTSAVRGWLNSASAADPGPPNGGAYFNLPDQMIVAGDVITAPLGLMRIEVPLGQTSTIHLSMVATFATSTMKGYGIIAARRAR